MFGKFTTFLIALLATVSYLSAVQAASTGDRILGNRLLKKASKPVEWDDLGFAWGKRSAPPMALEVPEGSPLEQLSRQRFVRSWKPAKKTNALEWEDLGWTWG